jgi:hypothetical protein
VITTYYNSNSWDLQSTSLQGGHLVAMGFKNMATWWCVFWFYGSSIDVLFRDVFSKDGDFVPVQLWQNTGISPSDADFIKLAWFLFLQQSWVWTWNNFIFLAQKSWINPITDVFNAYQMQIELTQISILKLHQTRTNIPTSGNIRKPPKKNRISSPTGWKRQSMWIGDHGVRLVFGKSAGNPWKSHLVGGSPTPKTTENYEFVSWDDDIPNQPDAPAGRFGLSWPLQWRSPPSHDVKKEILQPLL